MKARLAGNTARVGTDGVAGDAVAEAFRIYLRPGLLLALAAWLGFSALR